MTRRWRRRTSEMSAPTTIPDALADTTPATKLVWQMLALEDELTQYELEDRAQLAHTTVTRALSELQSRGLVDRRPKLHPPTQYVYYRTGSCSF